MTAYCEMNIDQGATYKRIFQVYDADQLLFDLTGCKLVMRFKASYGSRIVLLQADDDNGKLVVGSNSSTMILRLTRDDTNKLTSSGVHQTMLTLPNLEPLSAVHGQFTVNPRI